MAVVCKAPLVCERRARLPTVKAGGMRVSKKQAPEESRAHEKHQKKQTAEMPSSLMNMTNMQAMGLLTGALQKLCHDVPADAAYLAHHKPLPTVDKTLSPKRLYIIQQPRRF